MTKKETAKILMALSAFYGEGKAQINIMVEVWHEILKPYEFELVNRAIMNFARNDKREYASFPAPGRIIEAIKDEVAVFSKLYDAILNNRYYELLDVQAQALISKEAFERLSARPKEEKLEDRDRVVKELMKGGETLCLSE